MHCNTAYLLDSLNKSTNKPNFQPSNSFPSHHPFIGSNCSWSCSTAPAKPKLSATIISQTTNCKFSNSLENIPAFKKGQVGGESAVQLENSSVEISKPKARFPSIIQRKKVLRTEIKKEYLDSIGNIKQCKKGDRIRKVAKNQMCSSTNNKMIAISYPSTNRVKPIGRTSNDGSRNYHPCSTPDAANFAQKFSKNALFGGELSSYYKTQDFPKNESMFLESGETGPASERLRQMAARYQNQSISDGFYSEYGEVRSMEALTSSSNFNYQMPFTSNNELQESKNSCPPSHPDETIFVPHLETKQFPQNAAYPTPTSTEIATQPQVKASSPVCSTNHSKVPPFQNFHIRSYYHQQQPTGDYASNNKNDNYADPGSYATRTTACTRIVDMNCNLSTSDARAIENGSANVGHCYNDFTTEHSRKLNDEVYSPWSTNNFYYHCNLNQGWPDLPGYYVEKEKLPTGNNSSRSLKSAPDGYSAEEQEFAANNFSSPGSSLCLAQHPPPGSQKFHLGEITDQTTSSYAQNDPSWPAPQPFSFWHHQSTQYSLPTSQVDYTSDEFSQTLQQSDVLISSLPEICNKSETKPPPPPYLSPKSKRKVCAVVNPSVVSKPDKNDRTFSDDKNEMDLIKPLQAFDEANKQVSIELSKTSAHIDEAACIGLATSISFGSDCFQDSFSSSIYQHKLSTT